ncbi:MAG: hypothetical protein HY329_01170 [Chloroflexi bacterium]|nr:hypothetical protein [Chloroflexota bacterium]
MTTIVVSNVIANKYANGGNVWAVLNWVLGLQRLGFQVYFLEQISPTACVDAGGSVVPFEHSVNLAYFRQIMAQFGLADRAVLVCEDGQQIDGLTQPELLDLADAADLLVNFTGHLTLAPVLSRFSRKVYVDFDPGFTQFWHASGLLGARLEGYEHYFTVGENIGTPGCAIPVENIPWRPIRQPVVLDYCVTSNAGDRDRFTTVASWRGAYGPVEHGGKTYGQKAHEFRKFVELPRRVPQSFELALDIHPADEKDRRLLREHGWQIVDPRLVAPDALSFDRYLRASGGEFSAAQGVYAGTESGWFSDRTVRYLAFGKPALVQDTGFSRNYPVGEGLLAFQTLEEAVAGAEAVARDYDRHSRAARALAATYFDSDKVLSHFIDEVDIAP